MKPGAWELAVAALVLGAIASPGRCLAQVVPSGAAGFRYATNFSSVAYFEPPNEQLVKLRLSGAEAAPLPGAQYDLKKLKLEYFNTDRKLQAVAEAPQCTYAIEDQIASSPGHLKLTSGDGRFHTEGDGFLFREDESWLMISNHVHSVFKMNTRQLTRL